MLPSCGLVGWLAGLLAGRRSPPVRTASHLHTPAVDVFFFRPRTPKCAKNAECVFVVAVVVVFGRWTSYRNH